MSTTPVAVPLAGLVMTHAEKAARRRLIAEAVRKGQSGPEVARMFAVSLRTVQAACQEFDVPLPPQGRRRRRPGGSAT